MVSPRTGRPRLDNALSNDIKVRIDDDLHKRLLAYCEEHGQSKAEVIRHAIIMLLDAK